MIEFKLTSYTKKIDLDIPNLLNFKKPIIYYLMHKEDKRPFFVTFVIIDFAKRELLYLFSYNKENIDILDDQPDNKKFIMEKSPHMTLSVHDGEDFITFIDEEQFLVYVNYKELIMKVYTGNDLVKDDTIAFKRISSTVYKDQEDSNYFFMSITDSTNLVHVFRATLNLDSFVEIDSFQGHEIPPHVIRNHKDYLLMSHVFRYPTYITEDNGKLIDQEKLAALILKNAIKIVMRDQQGASHTWDLRYITLSPEQKREILLLLRDKHKVKNLPGEILLLHKNSKEKKLYETSGGTPAHFELDTRTDNIYTSSHNFIIIQGAMIFYEPAVLDKFQLVEDRLELVGSFRDPDGYRYTSHRVFYYKEKPYICTFGQPSRLMIIDATEMKLIYSQDIELDGLSKAEDTFLYVNTQAGSFEIVAIEVSENGEDIMFIGPEYIYIYNFPERKICGKISYKASEADPHYLNDYKIKTLHINYVE